MGNFGRRHTQEVSRTELCDSRPILHGEDTTLLSEGVFLDFHLIKTNALKNG